MFNLKQEREELKKVVEAQKYTTERVQEDEIVLHERIRSLDEELTNMVPVEKFQNVCYELSAALKREEEAQGLLEEQTTQMEEMGKR